MISFLAVAFLSSQSTMDASTSTASAEPRVYGLQQLFPDPDDEAATNLKEVDIVVIHGLGARSPDTWIAWKVDGDRHSGDVNWLRDPDMLPSSMPTARILAYDWNADYDKGASSDIFLGHADAFLDRIHVDRSRRSRLHTPVIFIASCFGGLLLAKALVRATEQSHPRRERNQQMLNSVIGLTFLGTPFAASWEMGRKAAEMRLEAARLAAAEEGIQYSTELVSYLAPTTPDVPSPLNELVQRFGEMVAHSDFKIPVVCFYETRHTNFSAYKSRLPKSDAPTEFDGPGSGIVVTRESATLPGADCISLDVRHSMLHKFNSPEDDGFQRLAERLDNFVSCAHHILKSRACVPPVTETFPLKDPTGRARDIIKTASEGVAFANMTRRCTELKQVRVVSRTAHWLPDTDEFKAWESQALRGGRLPLLVIEGKAGSGKSIIMHTTFVHTRSRASLDKDIYILYCFDANNGSSLQTSQQGLYRSILYQILDQINPSGITSHYVGGWDETENAHRDIVTLKDRILWLLSQAGAGIVNIYVDALDECVGQDKYETSPAIEILEFLEAMGETGAPLRVCLSIRNGKRFGSHLNPTQKIRIDQRNHKSIHRYIEDRLKPPGTLGFRTALIQNLLSRSSNMFQWVVLVVRRINEMTNRGASEEEVLTEVGRLPKELEALYESFLMRIDPENRGEAITLLQLVQVAMRPLKLSEIISALEYANGTDDGRKEYSPMSLQQLDDRVQFLCQGLVETKVIRRSRIAVFAMDTEYTYEEEVLVQLTHPSVREFLEQRKQLDINSPLQSVTQSHLRVARLCMRVVKLNDANSSFLSYASQFWTMHARKGDEAIDDSFEPPSFVTKCGRRRTIEQWKRCVVKQTRITFLESKEDFPNTRMLRAGEESLLLLLAFEGCKGLIIRHCRDCSKGPNCHRNPSVLEAAIFLAAFRGWSEVVKAIAHLAEQNSVKIDMNKAYPHTSQTPLFIATICGQDDVVRALLGMGCDIVDKTNNPPQHPFHTAVEHGYIHIVRLFLEHAQHDVESLLATKDLWGYTPFHRAAESGRWRVFEELLDALLDLECVENPSELLNVKSVASMTALDLAAAGREQRLQKPQRGISVQDYDCIIAELERYGRRSS
ncbi:hypothetical protein BKA56DRAFT_680749 [Ilyonectria sp. MPI-CAGE-AT-0026]|nr:hypothetical protein BKA56DRAFT_680749 [Ilyonectria sp. MPI-CAGE-AT-0026]